MMTAMLVAAVLMADGGTSSEMFNSMKDNLAKNAAEKILAADAGVKAQSETKKAAPKKVEKKEDEPAPLGFDAAVLFGAKGLADTFTEKLGIKTSVKELLISKNLKDPRGNPAPDMAIVVFSNEKETFALILLGVNGELKVLPRDFKEWGKDSE